MAVRIGFVFATALLASLTGAGTSVAQSAGPQVPNLANPAPSHPIGTDGEPTNAPAKTREKQESLQGKDRSSGVETPVVR